MFNLVFLLEFAILLQVVHLQSDGAFSTVAVQFTKLTYVDGKLADGTCCDQSCDPTKCQGQLIVSFGPAGKTKDFGALPTGCKVCELNLAFHTIGYPLQSSFYYSWKVIDVVTGKLIDKFWQDILVYPYITFGSPKMKGIFGRIEAGNYIKIMCINRYGLYCQSHCTPTEKTVCDAITVKLICANGKFGFDCDLAMPPCNFNPCRNGALCIDLNSHFQCACAENFTGIFCQNLACFDGLCPINGFCINNRQCICDDYHEGIVCEIEKCSSNVCGKYGTCSIVNNKARCACNGSIAFGNSCQFVCPQLCQHEAGCQARSFINACICEGPFTGPDCSIPGYQPLFYDPCYNGNFADLIHRPLTCNCSSYWSGKLCSIPACNTNNCVNGICIEDIGCSCNIGFNGPTCSNPTCYAYNLCRNRGVCRIDAKLGHVCDCDESLFTGMFCQYQCPHRCMMGNGKCGVVNGILKCICNNGFTGDKCSEIARIDACNPNPCEHGTCTIVGDPTSSLFSCVCEDKWMGKFCNESSCSPATCIHGVCSSGVDCFCYSGYKGENCETVTENVFKDVCQRNGFDSVVEEQFTFCNCNPKEFIPPVCDIKCESKCVNGQCSIINGKPGCLCEAGFFGKICDNNKEFPELYRRQIIYITLMTVFAALFIPLGILMWFFKTRDSKIARRNKRFMHPANLSRISPIKASTKHDSYGTSSAQFTIKPLSIKKH